jgi:hypothetical protein
MHRQIGSVFTHQPRCMQSAAPLTAVAGDLDCLQSVGNLAE